MMTRPRRPLVLMILDGWGINSSCEGNAVCLARTPRLDELFEKYPSTRLAVSGRDVGLPDGQMGNSEVGHLNIGAGRIVYQDLTRISRSIETGDFFTNPVLTGAMSSIRAAAGKLHLMGLLSDGGVHSHISHLYALVDLARREGIQEICIHAFLDGRDTPPQSGAGYLADLEKNLAAMGTGRVATVIGRFYAMDRDNRWDRVEQAYQALTEGVGSIRGTSAEAISLAYEAGQTDEFVEPCIISAGDPSGRVDDGDGIIFFNFRADRAREITRAFTQKDFSGFRRNKVPDLAAYVCLTEYDATFDLPVAYPPESYRNILGQVIAEAGLRQLRIAETEKYAHVTFFFNGGSEIPFAGEDRVLIPSPQEVKTYDLKPSMSAPEVAEEMVQRVESGLYDLIVLNFANPDMVGHSGNLGAAVAAMEAVDNCVGGVVEAVLGAGGALLITADHGNCEQMVDSAGRPHTAHTANPVPLILVDPGRTGSRLREGILADIAPTILDLMGLAQPAEMTGHSLLDA
ncbi:MAG: 2,3-bisphosphoglycerate-independent phosphoglycerate mutase [Syntrophotaleaceae bacterium]